MPTCYKFTVHSAAEAAQLIRERLGGNARVLSVRNVTPTGLRGLFATTRLEVVATTAEADSRFSASSATTAEVMPGSSAPGATAAEAHAVSSAPAAGAPASAAGGTRRPGASGDFSSLRPLLRRAGFSETLLMRVAESPAWAGLESLPLHRGLVETGRHLQRLAAARVAAAPLTRAAFLGTPGVGRTTALCKWLATEVFRRARIGHVVTAEFDRPNPGGPLPVFCEAMGVPLAHFPASTEPATPGGFVYFDLPGLSVRDPGANAPLAEFLARERIEQRVLVLNAAYDHAALRGAWEAGCGLGATHVVFTHLDEVPHWGRLWDYVLDARLTPLFLATGPSLTGDAEEDVADALARRTLPVADAPEDPAEPEGEEAA
ncbi:MAG TPA: hypothetical protein VEB66_15770 [Opitutaceae bacterium]|nr:hypothetical protein [Opitutaceae bacterium]